MAFDLQGHRGARGLAPENTLIGFRTALTHGVTTLETDLGVTRDDVVVLSHDRRLNPDIVRNADGKWIDGPGPTIRSLSLSELKRYDVGRLNPASRYAQQFPEQKPADGERVPTLAALFGLAGPDVRFNIETKIDPTKPDETVDPATFARLAIEAVRAAKVEQRTTLQSFDWRTLIEARRLAPEIETVCLTIETSNTDNVGRNAGRPSPWLGGLELAQHGGSLARLVQAAGCRTWSPFWRNVTAENIVESQALGLKVVPWTVNAPADVGRLIDLKVDGLITDYPDRAASLLSLKGLKVR
jgi:glycerophosphoryl diester phosphodiesterase